jgi:hypothetical protein
LPASFFCVSNNHEWDAVMTPLNRAHRAHSACDYNRAAIETGARCGCFYCQEIFSPTETPIKEWTDYQRTAICPLCGIDSVISSVDIPEILDKQFLETMNQKWFGNLT